MATNTYKAQLNYYDHTYGWGNAGTCSQGNGTAYGAGSARTGVLYFPGMSSLKNKIINKVTITTTNTASGQNASKTAHFYRSASQGGIKTSLGANHRTGSQIGTLTGYFHAYANASLTFTPTFFAQYIAAGEDTYCIYSNAAADYLVWSAVSVTVDWSEPATQPSLSKSTVEMGTAVTISTPATNSAYRHTLRYAFGGASGTIATGVASAHTWTPPVSLATQIPSAASGSGTVYCDTYSGSTLLGTKSVAIALTVPASVVPSAGTLSVAVADDTSGTGMYVKGMGKARLTLSGAAGAQGSSIKSYRISGGGWSASSSTLTTGILSTAGSITFTATVTDSRGRTASTTAGINVIDYAKPGITSCTVYRCDSAGNRKNDGAYAAIEIKATYSAISGNSLTLKAAYKLASDTSYGSAIALTNNGRTVIGGGAISAEKTYQVQITVADRYNSVQQIYPLGTRRVSTSDFFGRGFAVGKVAESPDLLDVAWDERVRGNLQVDGNVTWPDQYQITYYKLPNGADLNDYRSSGFYRAVTASNSYSNLPAGARGAFELIVTSISDGVYCTQRLKDYASNSEWVRTQTTWKEPWAWTGWAEIMRSNNAAKLKSPNNLTHNGNEVTWIPAGYNSTLWFNYRADGGTGYISSYKFGDGSATGTHTEIWARSLRVDDPETTRTNLGFKTTLLSSAAATGTVTLKAANGWSGGYRFYMILVSLADSNNPVSGIVLPREVITGSSSGTVWSISTASSAKLCRVYYSGNDLYVAYFSHQGSGGGSAYSRIYGVV